MQKEEKESIEAWAKAAADFHGHLGPFLVLGVRMGLIGLRKLQTSRGVLELHTTAILKHEVPFSCTIDGIQVVTQCTMGNGRLQIRNAKNRFAAKFQLTNRRTITVTFKPARFEELKNALPKTARSYKNIQLAKRVASLPEAELFTVETK